MDFQFILELLKKSKDKHRTFRCIQSALSILNSESDKEEEAKYLVVIKEIDYEGEELEVINGLLRMANECLSAYRNQPSTMTVEETEIKTMDDVMKKAWSLM